jgi:hypothetical protein
MKKVGESVTRRSQRFLNVDFEVSANEELVLDSVGSIMRGILPIRGRLLLTNKRLVFLPMYVRYIPRLWKPTEVPLEKIATVSRGWCTVRIHGRNHERFKFLTFVPGRWEEEISKLLAA